MREYQRISLGLWLYFTNQHFLKNIFFWDKTFLPGSYLNLFLGFLRAFFSTCAADTYQSSRVKRPQESYTWSQELVGVTPGLTTNAVSEDQSSGRNIHRSLLVEATHLKKITVDCQLESYFKVYTGENQKIIEVPPSRRAFSSSTTTSRWMDGFVDKKKILSFWVLLMLQKFSPPPGM